MFTTRNHPEPGTAPRPGTPTPDDSAVGNARLTSALGLILLVLLAVEGYTILDVRRMITLHIVLGLLLIGPVLAKTATTGYRFVRYYSGTPAYQRKGPPHLVLRVLGPLVILTSLAVLGSGVLLVDVGRDGPWLLLHKASFVIWFAVMTVHVLGHLLEAVRETVAEARRPAVRGRALRLTGVAAAVLLGAGLALALYPSGGYFGH